MERTKVKNGEKSPWGQCLYQTSSKRSPPFWLLIGARKLVFFWHQSEARTAATVWNWSGKTLFPGALLAVFYFPSFHIYFPARLDFPSPPLSAPRSPRMPRRPHERSRYYDVKRRLSRHALLQKIVTNIQRLETNQNMI